MLVTGSAKLATYTVERREGAKGNVVSRLGGSGWSDRGTTHAGAPRGEMYVFCVIQGIANQGEQSDGSGNGQ